MNFEKHEQLYNHLHNHNIEYFHHPKKIFVCVSLSSEFSSLIPWPLKTTNLLPTTTVLLFLKCYINGVIQYIFKDLSLSIVHLRFIHVFAISVVRSPLLISISLVCLSSSSLPKSRLT